MKKPMIGAFLATSAIFLGVGASSALAQMPAPSNSANGATAAAAASQLNEDSDAPDQKTALARYLQRSFDHVDTNHDGVIDRKEWAAFQEKYLARQRQLFEARFKRADTNGDGYIDRDEAKAAEPFLYEHFDEIDLNHDGKLSPAEIRSFIRRFRRQQAAMDNGQTKP